MKKIQVITENCIGCGACVGIDEEHFDFNEDGYSIVKSNENLESESLQDAIEACPVAIISIVDDGTKYQTCEHECCSKHEQENTQEPCHCEENCHCEGECHCRQEEENSKEINEE